MHYDHKEEVLEEIAIDELLDNNNNLIVFNDDVNTFDHVTNTLIKICKHSQEQAEQCTWIIHYKGKCAVKEGPATKLKPLKEAILDAGIQATIF